MPKKPTQSQRIDELERRIRELEARPVTAPMQPVLIPTNPSPSSQPWEPQPFGLATWGTCIMPRQSTGVFQVSNREGQ